MNAITVAYHTGRKQPRFDWFFDSLALQKGVDRIKQIIVVDYYAQICDGWTQQDVHDRGLSVATAAVRAGFSPLSIAWKPPKPTIWQGPHRVTREPWWAMSNARNTSFALCRSPWIILLDDRCVLQPGYIQCVKRALGRNHIVFGSYQKQHGLVVERGVIKANGTVTGVDNRESMATGVTKANGAWAYGCSLALPLEWALQVNGYPERADGMGFEDILFGMVLHNNGFTMRYDPAMRVIQDRTPSELDKPFRREDKGKSPDDKSHASLREIGGKRRSENEFELRDVRKAVLSDNPFPLPANPDPRDWYDNQPIRGL